MAGKINCVPWIVGFCVLSVAISVTAIIMSSFTLNARSFERVYVSGRLPSGAMLELDGAGGSLRLEVPDAPDALRCAYSADDGVTHHLVRGTQTLNVTSDRLSCFAVDSKGMLRVY